MEDDKSLIIKNVVPSDEGIYICEAHNSIGQISAKAQLGVNCKYNPPPNSRPSCVAPALCLSIIESLPKLTSIEMCTPHITYISEYDNGTHSTTPHSRISTWLHARTHPLLNELTCAQYVYPLHHRHHHHRHPDSAAGRQAQLSFRQIIKSTQCTARNLCRLAHAHARACSRIFIEPE